MLTDNYVFTSPYSDLLEHDDILFVGARFEKYRGSVSQALQIIHLLRESPDSAAGGSILQSAGFILYEQLAQLAQDVVQYFGERYALDIDPFPLPHVVDITDKPLQNAMPHADELIAHVFTHATGPLLVTGVTHLRDQCRQRFAGRKSSYAGLHLTIKGAVNTYSENGYDCLLEPDENGVELLARYLKGLFEQSTLLTDAEQYSLDGLAVFIPSSGAFYKTEHFIIKIEEHGNIIIQLPTPADALAVACYLNLHAEKGEYEPDANA